MTGQGKIIVGKRKVTVTQFSMPPFSKQSRERLSRNQFFKGNTNRFFQVERSGQSTGGARQELVRGGSLALIIRQETSNHPHYEVRN